MKQEIGLWAFGGLWLAAVLAAGCAWERYEATPGLAEAPMPTNPTAEPSGWLLSVYVHPRCPCSRVSIQQAIGLAGECPDLSVRVVFVRPPETPVGWERGELWDWVTRQPGVAVTCDTGGTEAKLVGAATSGATVLTDPSGAVVYRGGLTAGRGRDGESAGRLAVRGWLRGDASIPSAPVYGCPLHTPGA